MNSLIFTGRLGQDAMLKKLPSGTDVLEFQASMESGPYDKRTTHWVQCSIFGKRANEKLKASLVKGTKVLVRGEISLDVYKNMDGEAAGRIKVMVDEVEFMSSKRPGASESASEE